MEARVKIQVIDNEKAVAELLKRGLDAAGYDTVTFLDGDAALEQLEEEMPDLILLDIDMPGMDGYQVCRKIREQDAYDRVPVIMLTGLEEPSEIVRALHAGADDYIFKSAVDGKLLRKIEDILVLARADNLPGVRSFRKSEKSSASDSGRG